MYVLARDTSAGGVPPWRGRQSAGRSGSGGWAWRWRCTAAPDTCAASRARRRTGCGSRPQRPWEQLHIQSAWTRKEPRGAPWRVCADTWYHEAPSPGPRRLRVRGASAQVTQEPSRLKHNVLMVETGCICCHGHQTASPGGGHHHGDLTASQDLHQLEVVIRGHSWQKQSATRRENYNNKEDGVKRSVHIYREKTVKRRNNSTPKDSLLK